MRKTRFIEYKVLLIALIISMCYSNLSGQNTTSNRNEIYFNYNGNKLHGWFYKTSGIGPFSTVILFDGSVGQDGGDIFNLGESLSKVGFNVMTYNYPGLWRSEGNLTNTSALGSVQSAINFVKSEYAMHAFKTDTSDIILIGHSYGGGMALLGSASDPSIKKVVTIALGDLSLTAEQLAKSPEARSSFEQMVDGILKNPAVGRGTTGKKYTEEIVNNREKFNIKSHSDELAKKNLLFLVGWLDNFKRMENDVLPLYRELQTKGAIDVMVKAFETDHYFTNAETEMTETIIDWLRKK